MLNPALLTAKWLFEIILEISGNPAFIPTSLTLGSFLYLSIPP